MRIEMATALGRVTQFCQELEEPVSIIYGRSNSDRATYGNAARKEDVHLLAWITRYAARPPQALKDLLEITTGQVSRQWRQRLRGEPPAQEEWRTR